MQFRKTRLCSSISLVLYTGLYSGFLAATLVRQVNAQTEPQISRGEYGLDWVPREQMTAEELEQTPANCCGAFIEPVREGVDPEADPDTADTLFTVQNFSGASNEVITIDGPVMLQQGNRTIENTGETVISRNDDTLRMEGDVEFREPNLLLRGSSALVDRENNINQVESASYVIHDFGAHGSAGRITYNSESDIIVIENGQFSRCEPGSNFWYLEADQIRLDQVEGRGYADSVTLKVREVPIFHYPFTLPFPLGDRRMSGFLAPSTGHTRDGGYDLAVPYYFNLAPHYDATLTPRILTDRGLMTGAEVRYLAPWSINTVNLAHLGDDDRYELSPAGEPLVDSPPVEDRWFLGYEHFGALGDNWSTFVDYNAVSDAEYFRDLGSSGLNVASRTHLNRQGRLDFNGALFQASVNVQRIQVIDPFIPADGISKPYDKLPEFDIRTGFALPGAVDFTLQGEFTSFDRNLDESLLSMTQTANGALVTGDRLYLEPALSWALEAPGWFLRPTAKYKLTGYDLENQALGLNDDPEFGVGVFSVDGGLVFERMLQFASADFMQTLEPRLFYLYSEYEEQSMLPLFDTSEFNFSFSQLFRDDRFAGGDRVGDADQLTVALTSRLLDNRGRERASISVGQIHYFEDRRVTLENPLHHIEPRESPTSGTSDLVAELSYAFSDSWQLRAGAQWDQDAGEFDDGSFQFRYQSQNNAIFNVAFRYRDLVTLHGIVPPDIDPRIRQSDVSTVIPVNSNWRILGRWNYDHGNSRDLETFAGVEYSNCCTTIRLIAREWVDEDELFLADIEPDRGIFLQWTLNGLGNITGGGLSNLLNDGILGFREPYINED
ncbi:MAG: LPS-assembly protein LptD [Pseudohongiellaceae bacterium]